MARKNYVSKQARRNQRAELPEIEVAFNSDVTGLWAVELTDGSARTAVEVYGSLVSAWEWTDRAGESGGISGGLWWPVDITSAANLVRDESDSFLLV